MSGLHSLPPPGPARLGAPLPAGMGTVPGPGRLPALGLLSPVLGHVCRCRGRCVSSVPRLWLEGPGGTVRGTDAATASSWGLTPGQLREAVRVQDEAGVSHSGDGRRRRPLPPGLCSLRSAVPTPFRCLCGFLVPRPRLNLFPPPRRPPQPPGRPLPPHPPPIWLPFRARPRTGHPWSHLWAFARAVNSTPNTLPSSCHLAAVQSPGLTSHVTSPRKPPWRPCPRLLKPPVCLSPSSDGLLGSVYAAGAEPGANTHHLAEILTIRRSHIREDPHSSAVETGAQGGPVMCRHWNPPPPARAEFESWLCHSCAT